MTSVCTAFGTLLLGQGVPLSAARTADDVDDSDALILLRDIKAVWPDGEDKLETATLLEWLKALEESPW